MHKQYLVRLQSTRMISVLFSCYPKKEGEGLEETQVVLSPVCREREREQPERRAQVAYVTEDEQGKMEGAAAVGAPAGLDGGEGNEGVGELPIKCFL